jgi:hypothetical protein
VAERRTGWFADRGPTDDGWFPCVQTETLNLDLEVWFETEAECLRFIREEILGLGLLDEGP